ncbi:hypothetical protein D3C86_1600050 [compost metagenome]
MRLLVGRADIGEEGGVQAGAGGGLHPCFIGAVAITPLGLDFTAGEVAITGLGFLETERELAVFHRCQLLRPGAVLMRAVVPAVGNVPERSVHGIEVLDEGRAVAFLRVDRRCKSCGRKSRGKKNACLNAGDKCCHWFTSVVANKVFRMWAGRSWRPVWSQNRSSSCVCRCGFR